MSRTRDFRRAQRLRVITRRLRHIREWTTEWYRVAIPEGHPFWAARDEKRQNDYWGHDVPGRWAKQDPYAHGRCEVCREDKRAARLRMQKHLDAEAVQEYLRR